MAARDLFIRNDRERALVAQAAELAARFAPRAAIIDAKGAFPHANFADLRAAGYPALTVPVAYGGQGASLYEMLLSLETLAMGDGSTALVIGWHLGITHGLRESQAWPAERFAAFCRDVVESGALINACGTEPATGSPSRGGRPTTTARRAPDGGWIITGHKTWTTGSPVLTHFLVSAGIADSPDVGEFLVLRDTPGLEIEETWNSMGMRGTGSHDLHLREVHLPGDARVDGHSPGQRSRRSSSSGWLLHLAATYLGVAAAARDWALQFARTYQPNSLPHPIAQVPHVQALIGQMELDLFIARSSLYTVAAAYDAATPEQRMAFGPHLGAAKHTATNKALAVVDAAMRVVGGASLSRHNPLERYYRDVRAGLHNPPMDDVTLAQLARTALGEEPALPTAPEAP